APGQVHHLEAGAVRQAPALGDGAAAADLVGVDVHAVPGHRLPVQAQRVQQQAQAAAEVEHRRGGAAQGLEHAGIQRVGAQLGERVVVVVAVAVEALRQEGARDGAGLRGRERGVGGPEGHGVVLGGWSRRRATGRARRVHSAYMETEGCRPSSASMPGSAPRARLAGVMSTKATPRAAQAWRAAALQASSSRAMAATSRPEAAPNGVTPQSGMESTSTRSARPPAKPIARPSRAANSRAYSVTSRPRYWLFTPI